MKRIAAVGIVLPLAVFAFALTSFGKVFDATYKIEKTSNLAKEKCAVCHVNTKGGKMNPYGMDLGQAMAAAKSKKLTPEILKAVENLDSDKDGKKNIDEIKADRNPGEKGND